MEKEVLEKIEKQEKKLDKIYISVEKTRKYLLFTLIGTLLMFVIPLIAIIIIIPRIIDFYSGILSF